MDRWQRFIWLAGAFLYALLGSLGSQIDSVGCTEAARSLVGFLVRFPAALAILWILLKFLPEKWKYGKQTERDHHQISWKFTAGVFLILLLFWLPMFLIQYPGSFMYDTQRQTYQIARNHYDAFHPLIHTSMLRLCLAAFPLFQSIEKCAALYSVWQMLLLAFCFSQVVSSVGRVWGRGRGILAAAFFALYPAHMAMACNYVKDVLFSGFFSLFVILNFEDSGFGLHGIAKAELFVSGILACLFRNNMIYALAAWGILLLFFRKGRKRAVCVFLICAAALLANEGMIRALHAERGSVGEMLSVPVQQLARARTQCPSVFTEEEAAQMDSFFQSEGWKNYDPTLSDPVKVDLDEEKLRSGMGQFLKLWIEIGAKCPGVYLDAFLNLTLPSLYPYRQYHVSQPYLETGLQPGVVTAPFAQAPMTQPGRFAALRDWLDRNIYATGADHIPVLGWIMNTGVVYWFLLLCVIRILYEKDWKSFMIAMLPLLLYGTYLLGPVMQGRYLYPFVCVSPFLASSALKRKNQYPEAVL